MSECIEVYGGNSSQLRNNHFVLDHAQVISLLFVLRAIRSSERRMNALRNGQSLSVTSSVG